MTPLSLLVAAAGLALLAPTDAEACPPKECGASPRFLGLALGAAEISAGGVIAFATDQGSDQIVAPEDVIEQIQVTVTDAENAPVAGALEHAGGVYFWRPEAALAGGTTVTVDVTIDNDALDAKNECGVDTYGPLELAISQTALPALSLPELSFETSYSVQPLSQLDSVVCCDGAYPEQPVGSCIDEVLWSEGYCTAHQGTGFADGLFDLSGLDPLLAASVRAEIVVDGEVANAALGSDVLGPWGASRSGAFEVQVRLVSLIDGSAVESDPVTVDGGNPDGLGTIDLDVTDALERNCESAAYTCEVGGEFGDGWDPEACEPWDDDGGDTDGDTDSDSDGGSDSDSDGGSDSDSDGGADSGPESGSGSGSDTDGDSAGQDGDAGGCQVGPHGGRAGWLMLLGLAALPLLRRRRDVRPGGTP